MEITKTVAVDGKEYKVANGTYYHVDTNDNVISVLEHARLNDVRVRVFYGKDGLSWLDEYDIIGTISRSTGSIKIPLLIKSRNSYGGGAILTDCIIKITIDKDVVYKVPEYTEHVFSVIDRNVWRLPFTVTVDGDSYASFETKEKADNWIKFMKGERNKA